MGFLVFIFITHIPKTGSINDYALPSAILIYDRNNILLYSAYNNTYRIPIKIEKIPQIFIDATISAEDKRFYKHHGFDFLAMARAFIHNTYSSNLQGGSTITQQLAKNLYLTGEKSIIRKIKEAFITEKIELTLSKKRILELYFNTTPYGGVTVGIEAASVNYFGKSAKDLSSKEAIFLAALPVSPTILLEKNSKAINSRMEYVLNRMLDDKKITLQQKIKIEKQSLYVLPQVTYKRAPHAVDYVLTKLEKDYGDLIKSGKGLIVHTSIDLNLQNFIQQKILEQVTKYKFNNITNAAVIVVKPNTGELLSMVGSVNYYDDIYGQYNVITSPRQLGSAMKIVTYGYALDHGFQPTTTIVDAAVHFKDYPEYFPKNYDNKYHGTVTVKSAFANSYNIPALKVAYQFGVDNIAKFGVEMGIPELDFKNKPAPLSLVLGGVEVSVEHLTQAYAVVANNGRYVEINPFTEIIDYQGHKIYSKPVSQGTQVLTEKTAKNLYDILSDQNARIAMFGYSTQFDFGNDTIAIKTGTSNDNRDNTAFSFSPDIVVGTWMGNNNNSPMYSVSSGYVGSSSIMHDVTTKILENMKSMSLTLNKN